MRPTVLLALCCLACACGGDGSTRLCFGSEAFCESAFARNSPPTADAGPDLHVAAGEPVQLDGTGSVDPDGAIASYSWIQEDGPPVALENADAPVARFTAPTVTHTTPLVFRLVITDDDRASDTDRVRVTVAPLAAAALARGLALLKTVYRPRPEVLPETCLHCWSNLGLWLAARVLAAPADPEPDRLLDELRALTLLNDPPPPTLRGPRLTVYRQALGEVAAFTRLRDPATAERARRLAGAAAPDGDWPGLIAAACPPLKDRLTPPPPPDRLARWLLHVPPGAAAGASAEGSVSAGCAGGVAVATLLLARHRLDATPR